MAATTTKKMFCTSVAPTRPATVDPAMALRYRPSIATVPADAGRIELRPAPPA